MAKAEYRSAIRSRKLIKAALADLLQEKPLDKIAVTDVVNRAEINRGTFYAHYSDIPDVIDHLIGETFSRIQQVLSEAPCQIQDIPGILARQIQVILEEDLPFYRKVMDSGSSVLLQQRLTEIILEYLLQREADFAFGSHEQYILTIRFCAGGLSALYHDWFAGKIPLSLSQITAQAEKMLCGFLQ